MVSPCQGDGTFVAGALKHLAGEVVQVDGPAAVLELAGNCCFLLILLDLDCDPQWPGTVQALQTVAPGTAVVVYSRLPDERRWIEALDVGATDYMAKPFRAADLHWVWRSTVDRAAGTLGGGSARPPQSARSSDSAPAVGDDSRAG
ncbi:MAG TPA: hypothetical protein VEU62_20500 [Bryobacterales bacterium]|nr:hypothetical protein [Bryobacterales bacterium]